MEQFTFIDLFAGIGGFHQAMTNLGGKCVLASEIDRYAIAAYAANYGMDAAHDITMLPDEDIPAHDILCGGFPCQSFSKAGKRLGFADATKGTLFFEIVRILRSSQPRFLLLENVRNLASHDNGNTLRTILGSLDELGYNVKVVMMSPHQFGIPQLRERVYILGVRKDVYDGELTFQVPDASACLQGSIYDVLESDAPDTYRITAHEERVLTCWDEFHKGISDKVLGFPVWSSEFGSVADTSSLPSWKTAFCLKNRSLYERNKEFIDRWIQKWDYLQDFTPTERKLEWQAGDAIDSLWDGVIQFRPSGVRVKRPDTFPALVAIVQTPIIGKYKRRLTPREAARLQAFPDTFIPCANDHQAYKQFGNAVNVKCVQYLAEQLFAQTT